MIVIVKPGNIKGKITAPASKSAMQRACAAALLSDKKCYIHNFGKSMDDKAALNIVKDLGAKITPINDQTICIDSSVPTQTIQQEIYCGESGLSIRMFSPIAALQENTITVNGSGSLLNRPMDFFDTIFPKLNVSIQSNNGKLPLQIKGPLKPQNITIDGSMSSQFLTGLLMAFSSADKTSKVSIEVNQLKSKPYIDLTLAVMDAFELPVPRNENYTRFTFEASSKMSKSTSDIHYTVEGDWSGAAFLLVAGATRGNIVVNGLSTKSTQADKAILHALKDCGANFEIDVNDAISIQQSELKAFEFDATDCPDLFPPLVALAANCNGISKIKGIERLIHKESNRSQSLQSEFTKMDITISVDGDWMYIKGGNAIGAKVHAHHDHRIAMSCAVAALSAHGITQIEDAEAIQKSYPDFYAHLQQLGAAIYTQS